MFYISLRHSSEREALVGDLDGQWQSHMYPSEDAKRSLAHATQNCKNSIVAFETVRIRTLNHAVTIDVRSNLAIVTVLDEIWCLHRIYIH